MSNVHRIAGAAVVATIAVAAPIVTATSAHADSNRLDVRAVAAPVWDAQKQLPIKVVIHNASDELFCDQVEIAVAYEVNNGPVKRLLTSGAETTTANLSSVVLPAKEIKVGIVKYAVSATQYCGAFLSDNETERGRFPSAGWSQIRIVGDSLASR